MRALESALGLRAPRPGDRFATYAAALGLLAAAADRRPVLAVVDDAHWMDTASLEAVLFCARRIEADRIALVLCGREPPPDVLGATGLPELRLSGLGVDTTAQLLAERAPVPVAKQVTATLQRATAGNPLALVELLSLLDDTQLQGTRPLPELLPVGPAMRRAYGFQIARLPKRTQTALLLAAVEASGDLETLVSALRLRGLDLPALEPAEAAGLVALGEGRGEFCHPLLRAAAHQLASGPDRRDAHAALAEALLPPSRGRARRALHLAAAALEPDEQIAAELEAAATDAGRAAPEAAGRVLEAAAQLSPDAALRVQRRLAAARSYHLAGAGSHALRLLDEALGATEDPVARADIQHTRGHVMSLRGIAPETRALLVTEARRVEPVSPDRAAAMLLEAATMSIVLGEARESLRLAADAFAMAESPEGPLGRMAALVLGNARILCGDAVEGYPLVALARPLSESSEPSVFGFAATSLVQAELWSGTTRRRCACSATWCAGSGRGDHRPAVRAPAARLRALRLRRVASCTRGRHGVGRAGDGRRPAGARLHATGGARPGRRPAGGRRGPARAHLERARSIGEEFGLGWTRYHGRLGRRGARAGVGATRTRSRSWSRPPMQSPRRGGASPASRGGRRISPRHTSGPGGRAPPRRRSTSSRRRRSAPLRCLARAAGSAVPRHAGRR